MSNKLQFKRKTDIFTTRELALDYISLQETTGVSGEPVVVMYGSAINPSVILGIGSRNGKYFVIDAAYTQKEIDDVIMPGITTINDKIVVINTSISNIESIINKINSPTGAGLNTNGAYIKVLDEILQNANSLAEADTLLSNAIKGLRDGINNGSIQTTPKIKSATDNIIYISDNGLFATLKLDFNPNTGDLKLISGGDIDHTKQLGTTINLGLGVAGIVQMYYDPTSKAIVIEYKDGSGATKVIHVPVGDLIVSWEPALNNTGINIETTNSSILMKLVYNSSQNKDLLYADVKLDTTLPTNILKKGTTGALYVDGRAENLIYDSSTNTTIKQKIDSVDTSVTTAKNQANTYTDDKYNLAKSEWQSADNVIEDAANTYTNETVNTLATSVNTELFNEKTARETKDTDLQTQITTEKTARETKDTDLQTQITTISNRTVNGTSSGNNTPLTVTNLLDVNGNKAIDINLNASGVGGNILVKNPDGLYISTEIDYDQTTGKLNLVCSNGFTSSTDIVMNGLIQSINYDKTTRSLIINFKTSTGDITPVTIPLDDLIESWDIDNTVLDTHGKKTAVILTKHQDTTGGVDKLSAELQTLETSTFKNILEKTTEGQVFVRGEGDNIEFKNQTPPKHITSNNVQGALIDLDNYVDTLPKTDTKTINGLVSNDGSTLTLTHNDGTIIVVDTIKYMDNTDTFPTSVLLSDTVLTLLLNNGTNINCELKTLTNKGVKDGKLNDDLQHIDLTLLDNTEIHISLSTLLAKYYTKEEIDSMITSTNSFGGVTVNGSTILATQPNDAFSFVAGSNVTLTPDIPSKTITITATGGGGGGGDMFKSVYDSNNDGRVNSSDEATRLSTGRTLSLSGDATGTSPTFDGSTNTTIPLTLSNSGVTPGTYTKVIVDAKGRVTTGDNISNATTTIPGLMSDTDKTKLDLIQPGAEVNVQSDWNESNSTVDSYIINKPTLATVATSGSYNDLTNKPTIPTPLTVVQTTGTSTTDIMSQNAVTTVLSNITITTGNTNTTTLTGSGTSLSPLNVNVKLRTDDGSNTIIPIKSDTDGLFLDVLDFGEVTIP